MHKTARFTKTGSGQAYGKLKKTSFFLQLFANGATGFSMYPSVGIYDMSLWLAMRDVIELLTPFEDLLCDGTPATTAEVFPTLSDAAVVSAMAATCDCPCPCAPPALLVASSTITHGLATQWSVRAPTVRKRVFCAIYALK
jgi:hypothetical protein